MKAFPGRPLEGDWSYSWLDATDTKTREAGGITPAGAIVAVAVNTEWAVSTRYMTLETLARLGHHENSPAAIAAECAGNLNRRRPTQQRRSYTTSGDMTHYHAKSFGLIGFGPRQAECALW